MRVKNAFKVLLSNFGLIYKAAFARFICTAIFVLCGYLLLNKNLYPIITAEESKNLVYAVRDVFIKFFAGEGINTHAIPEAFNAFMAMLSGENAGNLFMIITETLATLFILRVAYQTGEYAFGKIINGYMSARTHFGFITTLLFDFGRALAYAVIYVLISLILETAIIVITIAILINTIEVISIGALLISIFFLVISSTFKYCLLSSFLPNMVTGKMGIIKALSRTVPHTKKHFSSLFGSYFFMIILFFYLNVTIMVFTFFMGLILTLPLTSLYYTTVSLVDYYHVKGKKYYADDDHIIVEKSIKEDAELTKFM